MKTLYDLLGALPHDDAEALRAAFRRAVKGVHPDLRPGDPDAALKFREIVRASEILGDAEQRAAYDDLLELARRERAPGYAIAARIHRLASGVIAVAGASAVMTVAGYLLFMHMSAASVAPANTVDATSRASPGIATVNAAGSADTADNLTPSAKSGNTGIATTANAPGSAMQETHAESVPTADIDPARVLAASEARFLRAPGIYVYRDSDPTGGVAGPDQAGRFDRTFWPAYVDRGILFYRLRKFDRAFADIAPAERTEKPRRSRSVAATAGKPRFDQAAIAAEPPLSRRRTAAQDPSRGEGIPSLSLR